MWHKSIQLTIYITTELLWRHYYKSAWWRNRFFVPIRWVCKRLLRHQRTYIRKASLFTPCTACVRVSVCMCILSFCPLLIYYIHLNTCTPNYCVRQCLYACVAWWTLFSSSPQNLFVHKMNWNTAHNSVWLLSTAMCFDTNKWMLTHMCVCVCKREDKAKRFVLMKKMRKTFLCVMCVYSAFISFYHKCAEDAAFWCVKEPTVLRKTNEWRIVYVYRCCVNKEEEENTRQPNRQNSSAFVHVNNSVIYSRRAFATTDKRDESERKKRENCSCSVLCAARETKK